MSRVPSCCVLILSLLGCVYATKWAEVPMIRHGVPGAASIPDFSDPADDIPKTREDAIAMASKYRYNPSEDAAENYNLEPKQFQTKRPAVEESKNMTEADPEELADKRPGVALALEKYLSMNDNAPGAMARKLKQPPVPDVPPPPRLSPPSQDGDDSVFNHHMFTLKGMRRKLQNLTHCNELRPRIPLQPAVIVDVPWIPFYEWGPLTGAVAVTFYTFTFVPARVVKEYRELYQKHVSDDVNWDNPKILVKETGPTEAYTNEYLLINKDKLGIFYALRKFEKPESMQHSNVILQTPTLLLKVEDPYLLVIYCEFEKVILMAQEGYVPETREEKEAEARTIHIGSIKRVGQALRRDKDAENRIIKQDAEFKKHSEIPKYLSIPQVDPGLLNLANERGAPWGAIDISRDLFLK